MRYYAKKSAALGFLVFLALWLVGAMRGITLPFWWFAAALAVGIVAATGVSVWALRQKPTA